MIFLISFLIRWSRNIILTLLLAGCSLSPVKTDIPKSYLLQTAINDNTGFNLKSHSNPKPDPKFNNTPAHQILWMPEITITPWLNTDRMAYVIDDNQIRYFAKNTWAAKPNGLLQPILAEALEQSGQYRAVLSGPVSSGYDQRLEIKILDFQQIFLNPPKIQSYYKITVQAALFNRYPHLKILRQKRLEFTEKALAADPKGGVEAANKAIIRLISALRLFIHDAQ